MKKIIFILFFGILSNFYLNALDVEGEIIFPNKVVKVTFDIPYKKKAGKILYENFHERLIYYSSSGKKKRLYTNNIVGINFEYAGRKIEMISVKPSDLGFMPRAIKSLENNFLLKLETLGKLSHYKLFRNSNDMTPYRESAYETDYLWREDKGFYPKQKIYHSHKEKLFEYLDDCEKLIKKFEPKKMRIPSFDFIANFYNENCE